MARSGADQTDAASAWGNARPAGTITRGRQTKEAPTGAHEREAGTDSASGGFGLEFIQQASQDSLLKVADAFQQNDIRSVFLLLESSDQEGCGTCVRRSLHRQSGRKERPNELWIDNRVHRQRPVADWVGTVPTSAPGDCIQHREGEQDRAQRFVCAPAPRPDATSPAIQSTA